MQLNDLIEQRTVFNNAAGKVSEDTINEIRRELERLAEAIELAEDKGFDERDKTFRVYGNGQQQEADREGERDELFHARAVIARNALEILQYVIPQLKVLADEMLAVTDKQTVRAICAPTLREGTDRSGKPYKPTPSKYMLPLGYESAIGKAKAAVFCR